jgi:hypothetical protein
MELTKRQRQFLNKRMKALAVISDELKAFLDKVE